MLGAMLAAYLRYSRKPESRKRAISAGSHVPQLDFYKADYRKRATMKSILERYDSLYTLKSTITSSNNFAGLIDFCMLLDQFCIKTLVFPSSVTIYSELATHGGRLREELTAHTTTH
ncbi:uncharacterized protein M421DRAFT_1555 [Didymella exigua CBS 183.55]|uniref:Uncharacterized protein n=1 Tax=Didymella exigua CBS 183.55 TaxID=1150837 RepID=A0A6A5RYQ1_9PLEO|nr:uncharacterized protein M421DRAFT_1555 [Didymella exigua CBS 183.55]KAF1932982.1 hypothetical protein M421DRAFT_1555 [Didymella exigua CBS 183.55]